MVDRLFVLRARVYSSWNRVTIRKEKKMRVISTGNEYDIFDDSLRTFDKLPTQTYVVRFHKQKGFFLEKYTDIEITESKVYGVHIGKVFKVLKAFECMTRNLGVILSGDKGIGKSLFAKMLAIEALKQGIPIIVVDTYYQGIASYIESIEQEVLVLFDEFDKTFGEVQAKDGEASPQANLLSLFDGISGGKKLFVVTCNSLYKLNEYLINRPGRFHYHFRFEYPSADEIREYLVDKLPEDRHEEIKNVVAFSSKVSLNYDCLRAIAFELAQGLSFKEAIADLNIVNVNNNERYDVVLTFKDGTTVTSRDISFDMFEKDYHASVYLYDSHSNNWVDANFTLGDAEFDPNNGNYVIQPEYVHLSYCPDEDDKKIVERVQEAGVLQLAIIRKRSKRIHYLV